MSMKHPSPSFFQLLTGSESTACCIRGEKNWTLLATADLAVPMDRQDVRKSRRQFHLGMLLQLHHLSLARQQQHPLQDSFLRRESRWNWVDLFVLFFAVVLLALLGIGYAHGGKVLELILISSQELCFFFVAFWIAQFTLNLLATLLVGHKLKGNARSWRHSLLGPRPLGIAWELERFVSESIGILAASFFISLALGWKLLLADQEISRIGLGMFLGAWTFFIVNASPLLPGPGSKLFQALVGVENQLQVKDQWFLSLVMHRSRLLPGNWSKTGFLAGFMMLAWVLACAFSFRFFADALTRPVYNNTSLFLVDWMLEIVGLFFCLWVIGRLAVQLWSHWKIRTRSNPNTIHPDSILLKKWQQESSLLAHVPELVQASWQWQIAAKGTLLVRQGENDRTFYWLASGTARIIGLDAQDEPQHWASLRGPCGFGEITFLHQGNRTASVLIEQDAVIAALRPQDSLLLNDKNTRRRFEEWVQASQAFNCSPLFHRLPGHAKEQWLLQAKIVRCAEGEQIFREGDPSDWLGLVVDGAQHVSRQGKPVAILQKGDVFGEMAAWAGTARQASITAHKEGVYLRWERDWWIQEAKRLGLASYLDTLVKTRQKELQDIGLVD